jgi:23S rRNA pseudouridine2605 synthase
VSAERLQKVLARAGVGSRRKIEELIREGRVTVNGQVAEIGQSADLAVDAVKVDDRRVQPSSKAHRYVLIYKPRGCVSTVTDPEGRPTVLDVVPQHLRTGLKPVGRLDFETEGLLLLTDDGELAHRVAHPSFGCTKTYEVKVRGRPADAEVARLREGVSIEGRLTRPASILPRIGSKGPRQSVANSWWVVTLGEGRTRQIREMFFRIGHPVQRLRRVAIGPLRDPYLKQGQWRELEDHEVDLLRNRLEGGKPARKKQPSPPRKDRAPKSKTAKGRPPKAAKARSPKARPPKARPPKARPAKARPPKAGPPKARAPKARPPAKGGPPKGRPAKGGPPKGRPAKGRPAKGRTPKGPGRGTRRGPPRRG